MNNKDLSILKVKDFSNKSFPLDDELHPNLPRHPFMMVLSSAPRSGKSNCLLNLVASSNFYNIKDKEDNPYFDQIYWCSPSANFDSSVKNVLAKMDNVTVIHEPNDLQNITTILNTIIASQSKLHKDNKPMERILFLMDDAIGYMNKEIALHTTKYRHFGTSIVCSGQKYSKFPLLIRTCMGHFITFKQNNGKEREKITEEIGESFCEPNEFESIMEAVTEQKYCFLYLNIEKLMMYKNFDTLLLDAS
jgi:hypothetical protein